ncbi:MAG: amino acid ABC transporter permease [Dehalococcoidia bacterium]|nr:MAG: amino acid ABC transporter permease [Dehalococcoidia bacterium]
MGLILGILLAIGDLYGGKIISTIIKFYVEFFRGSPIIIQLFIFYFSVPIMLNIRLGSTIVGFIVFALNSAAYQKGYIKGAMESVYKDQMTAALSLGLSKVQAIMYVVLPQAMRIMIPGWSNEFSSLGKSTAAILIIGERDLTAIGRTIAFRTFRFLETYAFIALIYFIFISIVLKILDIIYEKIKIPTIEISA